MNAPTLLPQILRTARNLACGAAAFLACSCAVGPNYVKPIINIPPAYSETPPAGADHWQAAAPRDAAERGRWWEVFADAQLNTLEGQIDGANLDVALAEAQFRAARAVLRGVRADLLPTVTVGASATRAQAASGQRATTYRAAADLSYEIDVWGRVRRGVEAGVAGVFASAADLEVVRLSMHAELALDYIDLRGLERQKHLLDSAMQSYELALHLTRDRYAQGVVSAVDVAQAQTQLESTRAEAIDLGIEHARLEHAIAVLVGKAPAELAITSGDLTAGPPQMPVGLPAELLERRPDVAAAERRVAAANAEVGVAVGAFFPRLTIPGELGYESSTVASWLTAPSRFWSLGPALVATVLDFGRRRASVEQARAAYDGTVAEYRLVVLDALADVEDNLAAMRILDEETAQQTAAVSAAEHALELAKNRYQGGVTSYLEVITAENVALSNERTAVGLETRRLAATVALIKALGGGWAADDLFATKTPPPPAR